MNIGETILNRYEIEDLLMEGGQARLAKALDKQTNCIVVIKQLSAFPKDPNYNEECARFQRAAQIRISHPNVVDPLDYHEEKGDHYIVMPFIEGDTLDNYIFKRGGRLPFHEALQIITEIASGLSAIHQQGIVDRDLKPSNIIVDPDNHPHIIDLGICKNTNEKTITKGSGLMGSLLWMSPEQVLYPGSEDFRSDIYSLGAIFYFMLTGSPPIRGNDAQSIILSICQYVPPSPRQLDPSIPVHVDEACMRLLAKEREARFQTVEAFVQVITGGPRSVAGPACISCGLAIQAGSNYCQNCGAQIDSLKDQTAKCFACGAQSGEGPQCPGCGRSFSHSDHRLTFSKGTLTGMTFRIPEGIFQIGRNELSPRDHMISRRHLNVACVDGSVAFEDSGSTNKTLVAGQIADHQIMLITNCEVCIAGNTGTYSHK